ncbi:hypothetical protein JCM15060_17230 [Halanaerobaculum tunisiense]
MKLHQAMKEKTEFNQEEIVELSQKLNELIYQYCKKDNILDKIKQTRL